MAIPPTSGPVYPHPLPLSDGDQTLSVELRETDDAAMERGMVAARRDGKGKRAEYRCLACGYASSFTGNLRAVRCVGRHAGSIPSGGLSRSYPTSHGTRSTRGLVRRGPGGQANEGDRG